MTEQNNLPASTSPMILIESAISKGTDIDKLERLFDLQERWEKSNAKKLFLSAMAAFQNDLPSIQKNGKSHRGDYATLDDIVATIKPVLSKHGLSYTWTRTQDEKTVTETCVISHEGGHSESASMTAPFDNSGGKNQIQAIASSMSYLRRYTLTGILGIVPSDEDDDGQAGGAKQPQRKTVTPENASLWQNAKNAFKRDGNFEKVLERADISDEHKKMIVQEVANEPA